MASCAVTGSGLPSRTSSSVDSVIWRRFEADRLEVARGPGGLESELLELRLDVPDGFQESGRAGVAAFELVVGEELDVAPPEFAFGGVIGGEKTWWRQKE